MNQETAQPRHKVLFLITKATWGGAQRYVFDLAANLTPDQFEPVVAYGTPGKLARELERVEIRSVPLPALDRDIALISDITSFLDILRLIRTERPDAVHVNSSKAAGLGALAARLAGVKRIIFTAHGWPHKEPHGMFVRTILLSLSWLTAFLSTDVIVISPEDESIGRRMPFVARKVRYIPIGRTLQELFPRETAWLFFRGLAPKLRAQKGAPRIVTIAELTRNKGIRHGIEAIALLKERGIGCTYTVIGNGEDYGALKQLAEERGVDDRVMLVGFVPDAAAYLRAFDIFLLPSLKEGMPYVLLEAGDAQLPIVTTTAVNADIQDAYKGVSIVPSGDSQALADALEATIKMLGSPKPPREESRYPLREMIAKTISLYR